MSEVRVGPFDVDNISDLEFPFCEFDDTYAEMRIVMSDAAD